MVRGQSWRVALIEAQMDAIAKTRDSLHAQCRVATLMEQEARQEREQKRQIRGR